MQGITSKNFSDLLLPVKAFLDKRSSQEENYRCERSLHPLTVRRTEPLEETIYKMVATRVHRLWVVDDDRRPIGTVSTTDLMRAFLQL
jgi:CBS domain-containing protein